MLVVCEKNWLSISGWVYTYYFLRRLHIFLVAYGTKICPIRAIIIKFWLQNSQCYNSFQFYFCNDFICLIRRIWMPFLNSYVQILISFTAAFTKGEGCYTTAFGIDENARATLEDIGQHFHVTRERIRQIESNALQKLRRNVENSPVHIINQVTYQYLVESGGIMKEDILIGKLLTEHSHFSYSALQLILTLDKRFERVPNTVQCHPYVKFKTCDVDSIKEILKKRMRFWKKKRLWEKSFI